MNRFLTTVKYYGGPGGYLKQILRLVYNYYMTTSRPFIRCQRLNYKLKAVKFLLESKIRWVYYFLEMNNILLCII